MFPVYTSLFFIFSALLFSSILMVQIYGVAIPLATHSIRPPVEIQKRSVAKIQGGRARRPAYQNSTDEVHPISDGINSLAKLGPGGSGSVSLNYFYRVDPATLIWYAVVGIGKPAHPYTVLLDTGSSGLVIPSSECNDENCRGHRKYNPVLSTTSRNTTKGFEIDYVDGTLLRGLQHTDNVIIAGMTAESQMFGAATRYGPNFAFKKRLPDGILGLAFESISESFIDGSPLMKTLQDQNKLDKPVFTLRLTKTDGLLYIGKILQELYQGVMNWVDVDSSRGFWGVTLDYIIVNGHRIKVSRSAILDTGADAIIGSSKVIGELFDHIPTHVRAQDLDLVYIPCNLRIRIILIIAGKEMEVSPDSFNIGPSYDPNYPSLCIAGAATNPGVKDDDDWIIGCAALRGFLTAWEFGKPQPRFGFAQLA